MGPALGRSGVARGIRVATHVFAVAGLVWAAPLGSRAAAEDEGGYAITRVDVEGPTEVEVGDEATYTAVWLMNGQPIPEGGLGAGSGGFVDVEFWWQVSPASVVAGGGVGDNWVTVTYGDEQAGTTPQIAVAVFINVTNSTGVPHTGWGTGYLDVTVFPEGGGGPPRAWIALMEAPEDDGTGEGGDTPTPVPDPGDDPEDPVPLPAEEAVEEGDGAGEGEEGGEDEGGSTVIGSPYPPVLELSEETGQVGGHIIPAVVITGIADGRRIIPPFRLEYPGYTPVGRMNVEDHYDYGYPVPDYGYHPYGNMMTFFYELKDGEWQLRWGQPAYYPEPLGPLAFPIIPLNTCVWNNGAFTLSYACPEMDDQVHIANTDGSHTLLPVTPLDIDVLNLCIYNGEVTATPGNVDFLLYDPTREGELAAPTVSFTIHDADPHSYAVHVWYGAVSAGRPGGYLPDTTLDDRQVCVVVAPEEGATSVDVAVPLIGEGGLTPGVDPAGPYAYNVTIEEFDGTSLPPASPRLDQFGLKSHCASVTECQMHLSAPQPADWTVPIDNVESGLSYTCLCAEELREFGVAVIDSQMRDRAASALDAAGGEHQAGVDRDNDGQTDGVAIYRFGGGADPDYAGRWFALLLGETAPWGTERPNRTHENTRFVPQMAWCDPTQGYAIATPDIEAGCPGLAEYAASALAAHASVTCPFWEASEDMLSAVIDANGDGNADEPFHCHGARVRTRMGLASFLHYCGHGVYPGEDADDPLTPHVAIVASRSLNEAVLADGERVPRRMSLLVSQEGMDQWFDPDGQTFGDWHDGEGAAEHWGEAVVPEGWCSPEDAAFPMIHAQLQGCGTAIGFGADPTDVGPDGQRNWGVGSIAEYFAGGAGALSASGTLANTPIVADLTEGWLTAFYTLADPQFGSEGFWSPAWLSPEEYTEFPYTIEAALMAAVSAMDDAFAVPALIGGEPRDIGPYGYLSFGEGAEDIPGWLYFGDQGSCLEPVPGERGE